MIDSARIPQFGKTEAERRKVFPVDCNAINEQDLYVFKIADFLCAIRRTPSAGALCGYVAVPRGKGWENVDLGKTGDEIRCHGGITFSEPELDVLDFARDKVLHWFGFDCAHVGDAMPITAMMLEKSGYKDQGAVLDGTYRNSTFVFQEVHDIVIQLETIQALLS